MQTHTFIAEDAQDAVRRIRAELGPTAVVRSVRKLPRNGFTRLLRKEQIEVVATIDEAQPAAKEPTPAAPAPLLDLQNEIRALKQEFAAFRGPGGRNTSDSLREILTEIGILPGFHGFLASELAAKGAAISLDTVNGVLRSQWRGGSVPQEAAVHIFVGSPGSGKTTILCKMLAQASLTERQPATVYQLDTHLANSSVQPPLFAEIMGARFERTLPTTFKWREESVFVDLPGVAVGDLKGLKALQEVISSFGVPEIHLVLNGAYEAGHLLKQVRFFSAIGITDLVVTHMDEECKWGKVWNLVLGADFEVRYLACGQNIPGDLHLASSDLLFTPEFARK